MNLWTEYEGKTVDGAYTLGKLLRSEGRNGFFTTSDNAGHAAVIRLTEAHFDEAEQLQRWRQVAGVHGDNLIEIERVGQTTFDGVALTYALMEPDDANLGDVLGERPLTAAETLQVARGVLAALSALHKSGLVHEHVEAANVLAVGDRVKLRSDCVRECVADVEFNTPEGCADLHRRDIRDFGHLLLRCLTLEKEWSPTISLPDPFRHILPQAVSGSWTLEQIGAVLDPAPAVPEPVVPQAPSSQPGTPAIPAKVAVNNAVLGSTSLAPLVPPGVRLGVTAAAATSRQESLPHHREPEPSIPIRSRHREKPSDASVQFPKRSWIVGGIAAILLFLFAGRMFFSKPAHPAHGPAQPVSRALPAAPEVVVRSAPAAVRPSATIVEPARDPAAPRARAASGPGWYVIAYTYNHEDQAQTKANRVNGRHAGLRAQVFSPFGHGPYFVSLGGAMSENEAEAVYRRARREDMPRDIFVRHY